MVRELASQLVVNPRTVSQAYGELEREGVLYVRTSGTGPLVVSQGVGSATNHAIGWVVIGGQTMVLAVALVVTPVAYSLFDEVQEAQVLRRGLAWVRFKRPAAVPVTEEPI